MEDTDQVKLAALRRLHEWLAAGVNDKYFLGVGARLSPLGTSATIWPTIPAPDAG
jgi:hypothetical protein